MRVERIGVDLDGVAADFNASFIDRTIDVTGVDLFPPRPFDIPTWNYPQHYGYTEAQVSAVWDSIKADRSFWFKLPPYSWTAKFLTRLNALSAGVEVYFITSRMGVRPKAQSEEWVMWNTEGFSRPTVLISGMKGYCAKALNLDAYIDDRDKNVQDVKIMSPNTVTYLLDQPWNRDLDVRDYPGLYRIKDPNDMLAAIAG